MQYLLTTVLICALVIGTVKGFTITVPSQSISTTKTSSSTIVMNVLQDPSLFFATEDRHHQLQKQQTHTISIENPIVSKINEIDIVMQEAEVTMAEAEVTMAEVEEALAAIAWGDEYEYNGGYYHDDDLVIVDNDIDVDDEEVVMEVEEVLWQAQEAIMVDGRNNYRIASILDNISLP